MYMLDFVKHNFKYHIRDQYLYYPTYDILSIKLGGVA